MQENENDKKSIFSNFVKYSLKIFVFILFLLAIPFINLYIIYLSFNIIVLNKSVDIKPLLKSIGNKFKEQNKDEEDDYFDEDELKILTEKDVVLLDAEDITEQQTKT